MFFSLCPGVHVYSKLIERFNDFYVVLCHVFRLFI